MKLATAPGKKEPSLSSVSSANDALIVAALKASSGNIFIWMQAREITKVRWNENKKDECVNILKRPSY